MAKEQICTLNGLKVLAVFVIFYWHSTLPKCTIDLGARCCELFFVISGFLTALNLKSHTDQIDACQYLKMKIKKMYPIHLFTFVITLLFLNGFEWIKVIFNLLLIQSWTLDSRIFFSYNSVSWFLSSLLFCYFVSVSIVKHIPVSVKKTIKILLFLLLFRILIEVLPSMTKYKLWEINFHVNPLVRLLEFSSGMFLFQLYGSVKNTKNNTVFVFLEILACLLIGIMCWANFPIRGVYIPCWCFFILIISLQKGFISAILSNRFILYFASIQLYFYMLHQVIIKLGAKYFYKDMNIYFYNLLIFGVTILISIFCKNLQKYLKKIAQFTL